MFCMDRVGDFLLGTIQGFESDLPLAKLVDGPVDGNPFDPGPESGVSPELVQVPEGFDKGILHEVFRFFPVVKDPEAGIEHCLGITPVQYLLRLSVAFAATGQ